MALQLDKTFSNGSSGNYWRITKCDANIKNSNIIFVIECWKDVSFRNAGAPSLEAVDLVMAGGDFADAPFPTNLSTTNIYAIGYAAFKTLDFFQGAIDV